MSIFKEIQKDCRLCDYHTEGGNCTYGTYAGMHEDERCMAFKLNQLIEAYVKETKAMSLKTELNLFLNWHDDTLGVSANKESNAMFINEYLKTNK